MKKTLALLGIFLLLCGCGKASIGNTTIDPGSSSVANTATTPSQAPSEPKASGNYFGDFSAKTLDGNTVTQDIFAQADLTVVNLWGTFCPPCISEMPVLGKLHNDLENVQFLGIVLDCFDQYGNTDPDQVDTAKAIMEQSDASYPCLILNTDLINLGMANYQYVPTTLFVDANGNLVGHEVVGAKDEDAWRSEISSRLEMIGQ